MERELKPILPTLIFVFGIPYAFILSIFILTWLLEVPLFKYKHNYVIFLLKFLKMTSYWANIKSVILKGAVQ